MPRERRRPAADSADAGRGSGRRRRRRWPVLVAVAVVAAAAGLWAARDPVASGAARLRDWTVDAAAAWSDWSGTLQDLAAGEPVPTTIPVEATPLRDSQSLLVVVGGADAAAFALVSIPPEGDPGLVMLPGSLLVLAPGYGEFTLNETLGLGGAGLVALAVANQLGLRIDAVAALPAGEFEAVLGEPLAVEVPVALLLEDENGEQRIIAEGRQRLDPDLVELLLTRRGTGDEFDLLRRQEAAWEAVIAGVGDLPGLADRIAAASDDPRVAAEALRQLAETEDPGIGSPPVERVSLDANREAFLLAAGAGDGYLSGALSHLLLAGGARPRVEVLNGNGRPGSADAVVADLVRAGFFVIETGNADRFDYPVSQVIAQGPDSESAAERARDVIGVGEVLLEATSPSTVVDVSIIVGTDISAGEG